MPVHQDTGTASIGLLNNPSDTKVNGRSRYLRIRHTAPQEGGVKIPFQVRKGLRVVVEARSR